MGWFRKKPDPISDRARALNDEIARLESQIRELDGQLQRDQTQPRLRSTALPRSSTILHGTPTPPPSPAPLAHEPIFEEVGQNVLEAPSEPATTPDHYNELGMRKYDLPALLRRLKEHFRGPSTTNPKLVSYLAAGGFQGLRPLRYEKRVARNRFIFFVIFLVLVLLGLCAVFLKDRR
jgi:hypothetical protein